jgi:DNA-directed RNA polymerase subunit RPC12/RpoP
MNGKTILESADDAMRDAELTVTVEIRCQNCNQWTNHTYNGTDMLLSSRIKCANCGSQRFAWNTTRKVTPQ